MHDKSKVATFPSRPRTLAVFHRYSRIANKRYRWSWHKKRLPRSVIPKINTRYVSFRGRVVSSWLLRILSALLTSDVIFQNDHCNCQHSLVCDSQSISLHESVNFSPRIGTCLRHSDLSPHAGQVSVEKQSVTRLHSILRATERHSDGQVQGRQETRLAIKLAKRNSTCVFPVRSTPRYFHLVVCAKASDNSRQQSSTDRPMMKGRREISISTSRMFKNTRRIPSINNLLNRSSLNLHLCLCITAKFIGLYVNLKLIVTAIIL